MPDDIHIPITINGNSPEFLGVSGLVIELRNQDACTATLTMRGSQASAAAALGPTLEIVADDFVFFGTIDAPTWTHTGNSREWQVTARDGWGKLADTTIYGAPALANLAIARDTRVVLGGRFVDVPDSTDFDLHPMPLDAWFTALAEFAGFEIEGDIPQILIPPAEADGLKVADAIRTVLRWFAGSVATVGGSAPTISGSATVLTVRNAAAMPAYTIPYSGRESVTIRPRTDLLVTGVRIYLRKKVSSNVASREDITMQDAGSIGPRAFITSIDLLPASHSLTVAELQVDPIEVESLAWWKKAMPALFLAYPALDTATVTAGSIFREFPQLDHIILAGSIPKNFSQGCSGPFGPTVKIISVSNSINPKVGTVRARARFTGGPGQGPAGVIVPIEFLATSLNDATSTITRYAQEDMAARDLGESAGDFAGLASAIYADAATLEHEGSVTWRVDALPDFASGPMGKRLSFSGAPEAAWNALAAPVHLVRMDCFKRQITAEFGPDTYLNVPDRVALERASRNWSRPKRRRLAQDGTEPPPSTPPAPQSPPTISQPPGDPPGSQEPFGLVAENLGTPANPNWRVKINHSTLANALPAGMTDTAVDFLFVPSAGTRLVYGRITINDTTGAVTERKILQAAAVPANTDTLHHVLIGSYVFAGGAITSVINHRHGPIDVTVCRNWFAAEAPFYGVTFAGS